MWKINDSVESVKPNGSFLKFERSLADPSIHNEVHLERKYQFKLF